MSTPEYMDGGEITFQSDIYCLGFVIMQIVTGQSKKNYTDANIASVRLILSKQLYINAPFSELPCTITISILS